MEFKDWKKYFNTLEKTELIKLNEALDTILSNEVIAREFKGIGLLDLKYLTACSITDKK